MAPIRTVLVVIIACGLLAAVLVCMDRHRVEQANRTVEIAVDYNEIATLAAVTGSAPKDVLAALKRAGATSVGLAEVSLRDLLDTGQAALLTAGTSVATTAGPLFLAAGPWDKPVAASLTAKFGPPGAIPWQQGMVVVTPAVARAQTVGVGYRPEAVRAIHAAGLRVLARPLVDYVSTPQAVAFVCQEARKQGATKVVFSGTTVLGYQGLLAQAAEGLQRNGLTYCSVEFGKQLGDPGLSQKMKATTVRLHSINENELPTLTPATAVERFVRGARERNIRVCYVRLFLNATENPLTTNAQLVNTIKSRLETSGFPIGEARPFQDLPFRDGRLRMVAGLAAVAGGILLLVYLWRLGSVWVFGLLALGLLASVAGPKAIGVQWYRLAALLAALVFPMLGVALTRIGDTARRTEFAPCWLRALQRFGIAVGCSLVGALLIAALLSDVTFLLQINRFVGVKLAQFAPLGLLAVILLGRPSGPAPESGEAVADYVPGWKRALGHAVEYGHVVILFAAMVVLAMLALRSGNEPAIGVSGAELKFRGLLESILIVRPRTKEFLIAHPLLLLAFALNARGHTRGMWLLVLFGAVGQCSMVNTFCHLHTPLSISIIRTFHGLWLGALIGTVLTWLVFRLVPRPRQEPGG